MPDGLVIRRATGSDRPAVLRLLTSTLGWLPDEHHAAFFEWKHDHNPFGASPAWVAIDEATGGLAGFRTFLRWEFERNGNVVHAVRAVDTATDPAHQGRGVFRLLTLQALDDLAEEGTAFVFNTPNDQSRPGYLKMGWKVVGRVPVAVRPRSIRTLMRVLKARTAADLWSLPCKAGEPVGSAIEHGQVPVPPRPSDGRLRTRLDADVLRWRYSGFTALGYRALVDPDDGGVAIVRLRRRGHAVEATIDDVLDIADDSAVVAHAAARVCRETGADYAIATQARPLGRAGFIPLPRQGPILTWRALSSTSCPRLDEWPLVLGDLELF